MSKIVLKLRREAPDWGKAKCLDTAPIRAPGESEVYDPWFDEDDPGPVMDICNGGDGYGVCPLREDCLIFALTNNEKYGVWGGTTEQDRKAIRKKWRWRPGSSDPRPEWRWYPPGYIASTLSPKEVAEMENEDGD